MTTPATLTGADNFGDCKPGQGELVDWDGDGHGVCISGFYPLSGNPDTANVEAMTAITIKPGSVEITVNPLFLSPTTAGQPAIVDLTQIGAALDLWTARDALAFQTTENATSDSCTSARYQDPILRIICDAPQATDATRIWGTPGTLSFQGPPPGYVTPASEMKQPQAD